MSALDTYDWDNDQRWQSYKRNVEFPEAKNEEEAIMMAKSRYFKKYIDTNFDPNTKNTTQPPPTKNTTQPPPTTSRRSSTNDTRPNTTSFQYIQSVWLFAHLCVVLFTIGYFLPFFGASSRSYSYAFYSAMLAHGISLFKAIGIPRFNQQTLIRVTMNDSAHYLLLYFLFAAYPPVTIALFPMTIFSFYHFCSFINSSSNTIVYSRLLPFYKYNIEPLILKVLSYQQKALIWSCQCEVMTIAVLILNLFIGYGSLILIFCYYWFLNFRYMTDGTIRLILDQLGYTLDGYFLGPSCPRLITSMHNAIRSFLRNSVQGQRQA